MSIARVFQDIRKIETERANARIRIYPGLWVFNPTEEQREHEIELKGRMLKSEDANRRTMYLVKQQGVHCSNPDVGQGRYPRGENHWWVPYYGECRKCEHYRKGGLDGLRYPHCDWARERRGGTKGGIRNAEEAIERIQKNAQNMVDEVLR